jgi:preprotein translocase subunit SecD
VDVVDGGNGLIRLTPTEPSIVERIRQAVEQSVQIVEKRVNELGTVEPLIQRQGNDRILVQVPGLQDPTRLKELLGKTAKLDFRFVDMSVVPVPQGGTLAGNVIAIKSLGAFVSTDQNQTVVGLGYTSESTAAIQDNSMVLGNPNAALASILEGER